MYKESFAEPAESTWSVSGFRNAGKPKVPRSRWKQHPNQKGGVQASCTKEGAPASSGSHAALHKKDDVDWVSVKAEGNEALRQ
jgi:hypothetical protein